MDYISKSADETIKIGVQIGESINEPCVIALRGGLGAGKTCITSGIAKGLGYNGETNSPTFSIVNEYKGGRLPIYHFDMYRIATWDDLEGVGFFDYLDTGVLIIEWSENIENALPKDTQVITLTVIDENTREIKRGVL